MNKNQHPATGIWSVAVQEIRVAGKWEREYEFAPGEWLIGFTQEGNYLETFRPEDERTASRWDHDEASGIISIHSREPGCAPTKCVLGTDGFLYYYEPLAHIPENAAAIIEHHAHTRLKLAAIDRS